MISSCNSRSSSRNNRFDEKSGRGTIASLLTVLKTCSLSRDLESGRRIHAEVIDSGLVSNTYVGNTLISMYSKCGSMAEAQQVFDTLPQQDEVSWNSLIHGYSLNGESDHVLRCYDQLQKVSQSRASNPKIYVAALGACATLAARAEVSTRWRVRAEVSTRWRVRAERIHSSAADNGCCNLFVDNALLNVYSKCYCMDRARALFDCMSSRDVVSWNSLLQAYVDNGLPEQAVHLFEEMESQCQPVARTYVAVFAACSALAGREEYGSHGLTFVSERVEKTRWLARARAIHARARRDRCCDVFVKSTLVSMYGGFGSMEEAREVFESMGDERDTVAWNSLLQGYVENGKSEVALEMLERMSSAPDARTYLFALNACASLAARDKELGVLQSTSNGWLAKGKEIHTRAAAAGCCNTFVENTLVNMYSQCGSLSDARAVFNRMRERDQVAWNSLLQGYSDNGESELALELFEMMREECRLNCRSYVAAMTACAAMGTKCLEKGRLLYREAAAGGQCDIYVENTAIYMYGKCGGVENAREVFDDMVDRSVVSWNCMIQAYVDSGENALAFDFISVMEGAGVAKTGATFITWLIVHGNLMALDKGEAVHEQVRRCGLERELAGWLVEFYAKCGCMHTAKTLFDSIALKHLWTWNALLSGYSLHGEAGKALEVFEAMREQGVACNTVTFTHLLTACSHAGLTDQGREVFESMPVKYGITPDLVHYTCMVDLFGRANDIEAAVKLVNIMPFQPDFVIWTSLLSACRKWNNFAIGKRAYECVLNLKLEEEVQKLGCKY